MIFEINDLEKISGVKKINVLSDKYYVGTDTVQLFILHNISARDGVFFYPRRCFICLEKFFKVFYDE